MSRSVLKEDSKLANRLTELITQLTDEGITFHASRSNTGVILVSIEDKTFMHGNGASLSTEFPPAEEGRFILTNEYGVEPEKVNSKFIIIRNKDEDGV